MGTTWTVMSLAVLVVLGWYLSFSAGRLDRLHARVEGARAALDAQLVRRASVALEIATSGLLDPASAVLLAAAAHDAREASEDSRDQAESDLTRALQAALGDVSDELAADPLGRDLLEELAAASKRVQLARRFHNDAVAASRDVRRKRVVRWLHLAGRAPLPDTVEIDDTEPVDPGSADRPR